MKALHSHHEHNYKESIPELIQHLKAGKSIALVSDAGTPGISDPGRQLAEACLAQGIVIHPIPGECYAVYSRTHTLVVEGFVIYRAICCNECYVC